MSFITKTRPYTLIPSSVMQISSYTLLLQKSSLLIVFFVAREAKSPNCMCRTKRSEYSNAKEKYLSILSVNPSYLRSI